MKTVFKVTYPSRIEKVETERETEKSIWIFGVRYPKISKGVRYFNNLEDAKAWFIQCKMSEIEKYNIWIKNAERKINEIKDIQDINARGVFLKKIH